MLIAMTMPTGRDGEAAEASLFDDLPLPSPEQVQQAQAKAAAMLAELETTTVDAIIDEGLHEFLSRFIGESAVLGHLMHECYLSGDVR